MNDLEATPPATQSARWGILAAVALLLIFAYWLRYILLPFVAAGALAYVARPLIHWLQRRFNFPRWLAALVPFLLFLGILSAIGYAVSDMLVPQLTQMLNNSQQMLEEFLKRVFIRFRLEGAALFGQKLDARVVAQNLIERLKSLASADALLAIDNGFAVLMGCVLTVVLFGFFIFTGPGLARGLLWLVPPAMRPRVRSLALQVDPMLANYLRGIFVIVLFTGGATWIVTGLIFHVSHAIFLAVAVGLLELIPVIGPILSFVTFGLVAVQEKGIGSVIGFGAFAIALRLAIDQLVGPLVLGRAARIPAVVVIFAFLAGGALYGVLGVLLAIPVAATVKIVLTNLYEGLPAPARAADG